MQQENSMPRSKRPTPRTRSSLALCLGLVCAALLPAAGCSVNASWQAGTTAGNGRAREARPANKENDAAARERARKRRAQDEIDRIDRESKQQVADAEREAAAREREADEEAERDRQRAEAEAEEQRKREAEAAAAAEKAKQPKQRRQGGSRFDMGTQGATGGGEADLVFQRRKTEINQSNEDKKAEIRKRLEKNKSDILVAAERKRTEVQESLKEQPEKKP
jgi:hypothetical protein